MSQTIDVEWITKIAIGPVWTVGRVLEQIPCQSAHLLHCAEHYLRGSNGHTGAGIPFMAKWRSIAGDGKGRPEEGMRGTKAFSANFDASQLRLPQRFGLIHTVGKVFEE